MSTLIFEGVGWDIAESSVRSGVGNCRIRTRLRNDEGRLIYLEMSGWIFQGKAPEYAKSFNCVGHVDHVFYSDSEWDSRRCVSSGLKFPPHFEYSRENILQLVNSVLNCSFDSIEVVNDGSIFAHDTQEPLCESTTHGYFTPYHDPIVNISTLEGITPLHAWHDHRMAKYQLDFEFVKNLPFIKRYIEGCSDRDQSRFPHQMYYINLRWDKNGTIISAEISSYQNFANFGIGVDTLHAAMNAIVESHKTAATV